MVFVSANAFQLNVGGCIDHQEVHGKYDETCPGERIAGAVGALECVFLWSPCLSVVVLVSLADTLEPQLILQLSPVA